MAQLAELRLPTLKSANDLAKCLLRGLGFGVWGSGFREVWDLGLGAQGLGI